MSKSMSKSSYWFMSDVDKLMRSVAIGDTSMASSLLSRGLNSNFATQSGLTPLYTAVHYGHEDMVNLLLKFGANPDTQEQGERVLELAARKGELNIVDALLKNRADPEKPSATSYTPLISASNNGHVAVVGTLLSFGAVTDARDKNGLTALLHASREGRLAVVELLLSYEANPNVTDHFGLSPLCLATMGGRSGVVDALLAYGADPQQRCGKHTAIELAAGYGHQDIIELLETHGRTEALPTQMQSYKAAHNDAVAIRLTNATAQTINTSSIETLLRHLDELIGLGSVKDDVKQLTNLIQFQQMRKAKGLSAPQQSLHMVFTGNPGTGKTTIARLIAQIYNSLGILSRGQFVETDRSGLVGGYVGQTALKVQEVVQSALGGVLFIDEAYSLTQRGMADGDAYGEEAISTLLKLMEDHRDDLIVIVAGYTEPMQKFIRSNPGLQSRFNKFLHFDDYAPAELTEIFRHFATSGDYMLHPATELKLTNVFAAHYAKRDETFGNARLARNLFEKAINAHANRMVSVGAVDEASLVTLYPDDIPNA